MWRALSSQRRVLDCLRISYSRLTNPNPFLKVYSVIARSGATKQSPFQPQCSSWFTPYPTQLQPTLAASHIRERNESNTSGSPSQRDDCICSDRDSCHCAPPAACRRPPVTLRPTCASAIAYSHSAAASVTHLRVHCHSFQFFPSLANRGIMQPRSLPIRADICHVFTNVLLNVPKSFTTGHFFRTPGLNGTSRPKREKSRCHARPPDVPSGVNGVEAEILTGYSKNPIHGKGEKDDNHYPAHQRPGTSRRREP
jgi:hypothetical protein